MVTPMQGTMWVAWRNEVRFFFYRACFEKEFPREKNILSDFFNVRKLNMSMKALIMFHLIKKKTTLNVFREKCKSLSGVDGT